MRLTRRGFFGVAIGVVAAAVVAPMLPAPRFVDELEALDVTRVDVFDAARFGEPLMYRGVPVFMDEHCPPNALYYFNANGPWKVHSGVAM